MKLRTSISMIATMPLFLASAWNAMAQTNPAVAPQQSTPVQLVDALNGVFGKHPDARAVHAKGIVLEGTFVPNPAAGSISKAPHLQRTTVPVTVRFSDFAGIPDIPDNDALAAPRGFAIKFALPDGNTTDIVAHSFNGFPSPTADDFRELLLALGSSGPTAAKPTALDVYFGKHAAAKAFLTAPKPAPVSYATLPFYGINTFRFVNAAGKVTYGRYQILPDAGAHYLTDAQTAKAKPNYLQNEIAQRVAKGAIKFKLVLQVAEQGDALDDPTVVWPATRQIVELGTISIARIVSDNAAAQRKLLFLPNALPAGIEVEDPMINARSAAYPISYGRRHQ